VLAFPEEVFLLAVCFADVVFRLVFADVFLPEDVVFFLLEEAVVFFPAAFPLLRVLFEAI
jgi:hypothetical protein